MAKAAQLSRLFAIRGLIKCEQFLPVGHAPQAVLTQGNQVWPVIAQGPRNRRRDDDGLIQWPGHTQNARRCVHRRTDHSEIKPGLAADVAI